MKLRRRSPGGNPLPGRTAIGDLASFERSGRSADGRPPGPDFCRMGRDTRAGVPSLTARARARRRRGRHGERRRHGGATSTAARRHGERGRQTWAGRRGPGRRGGAADERRAGKAAATDASQPFEKALHRAPRRVGLQPLRGPITDSGRIIGSPGSTRGQSITIIILMCSRPRLRGRSSRPPALLVASALACGFALAGCGGDSPAADGKLDVVVGFYPLQYAVEQVGGPHVSVRNLTRAGAEPHDLELTPREVGQVSRAGLVVYLKGFQPGVDEAVRSEGGDRGLDVSAAARLEGSAPAEEGEASPAGPTRTSGSTRPGWPTWATRSPAELAAADPANAADYDRGAATLRTGLEALDAELRDGPGRLHEPATGHQPPGVRVPGPPVRPAPDRDRRDLPRAGAGRRGAGGGGRPGPPRAGPDRLLRGPGQPGRSRRPWRPRPGPGPRCSTRSKG